MFKTKGLAGLVLAAGALLAVPSIAGAQPHPNGQPTTTPAPPASTATQAGEQPVEPAPPAPAPAPPASASASAPAATAPAPPPTKPPPAPPRRVEHKVTAPIIAAGIISGVALAAGTVFAVKAASAHSEYVAEPSTEVANDGEQAAFMADIAFGFSALFAFGALALYLLPDDPEPGKQGSSPSAPRSRRPSWLSTALRGARFQF